MSGHDPGQPAFSVICCIHVIEKWFRLCTNHFLKHYLGIQVVHQLSRVISLPLENYHLVYKCLSRIYILVSSSFSTGTVNWRNVLLSYLVHRCMFPSVSSLKTASVWPFLFLSGACPAFWGTVKPDSLALNIKVQLYYFHQPPFPTNTKKKHKLFICWNFLLVLLRCNFTMDSNWDVHW